MTSNVTQDGGDVLFGGGPNSVTQDAFDVLWNALDHESRVTEDGFDVLYNTNVTPPATYHNRTGRSFEINVSFMLPPEEKLYEYPTLGTAAPVIPDATFSPPHGYDEGLDDCFVIAQKGGDRTAPMSWALAVVNIGSGSGITPPVPRVSNYALCWIWFDAPGWGANAPASMKYSLTTAENPATGAHTQYSTQALRAIVIHKYLEPGRRYSVAVQLKKDTGSAGGVAANTAWNFDGYFKVWVTTDDGDPESFTLIDSGGGVTASGIEVYKGPTDSASYFIKYGIRYSGPDAMHWGLGLRSHVWRTAGFIPWGADAAPILNGGYRMIDRSANTITGIYGAGVYTLTATKAALGDAYVSLNHRGFANGNTNGGTAPMGFWGGSDYLNWAGLNAAGAASTPYNPEALRGYRLVTTADFTAGTPAATGAIFSMLQYTEVAVGGPYRMTILNGTTIGAFSALPVLVQAFRWNQREVIHSELRIWNAPRVYDAVDPILAARRCLSLRSSLELDDKTEPDLETLIARWAADDAGGAVLRESVVGGRRNGYFVPFGLGVGPGGTRGENIVFLSGEGEAIKIDFSENPVVQKVIEENLQSGNQGFGFEITCLFPEAFYAIQGPAETPPDGGVLAGSRPRFVPDVVTWDVPNPEASGANVSPRTLLALTFRGLRNDQNQTPFTFPVPWTVEVANRTDQENSDPVVHSDLLPWYVSGGTDISRYSTLAAWVGKFVTIQVGVQPIVGQTDSYDVYVAMRPKTSINPVSGDAGDAEFAYFSAGGTTYDSNPAYFTGAHITVRAKDLARSVVTVGGRWSPKHPQAGSKRLGYSELNARMILDEIRIFGCSPSGSLPTVNGGSPARDGKLIGLRCLPPRELTADDMVLPLGRDLRQANVTSESVTVVPSGGGKVFTAEAAVTSESVKGSMFTVKGDDRTISEPDTIPKTQQDLYRVSGVDAAGASLTLTRPFRGATRGSAAAGVLRLLYYTAFADDLSSRDLSLGAGNAYSPASSTIASATIVDDLWVNVAPINVNAGLRIYSPLGRGTLQDLLPRWTRGMVTPRHNPILGISGRGGELYCATQGAIYRGDDRWRQEGPTNEIQTSLAFLGERIKGTSISTPLHSDRVEFRSPFQSQVFLDAVSVVTSPTDAFATVYDLWVKLDELHDYQTALYLGDFATDPALLAGSTGNVCHLIIRFRRGVPEFVFGSTGIPITEKGLYIAAGSVAIVPGVWTHVRWSVASRKLGTIVKVPDLKVNGRNVSVTVNAQDTNVSLLDSVQASDWLTYADIVQPGVNGQLALGAARDSYRLPRDEPTIASGVQQVQAQRFHGWLHSLAGSLAEVVVTHQTAWSGSQTGSPAPNFDPHTLDYSTVLSEEFHVLGANAEGVGHKILDAVSSKVGVIKSSPFRSVFHELGRSTLVAAWAQFGIQLYATNGGKPAVIINGKGRTAGVTPPSIKPDFTIQRFPVWESNVRDKTTAANPANDPLNAAAPGATPINHYRTTGNAYFRQELSTTDAATFAWTKDRYFAFKCYFKPETVSGRISIWRRGQSKDSGGPFVEIRDGKCVFGWYDSFLKAEQTISTDAPVFFPGRVHYIYIRKRFPQADALEGNWVNSYYSGASGISTVRRVTTAVGGSGTFLVNETITGGAGTGRVLRFVRATASVPGFMEYAKVSGDFVAGNTITGGTSAATATVATPSGLICPMHDMMVVRVLRTTAPTTANVTNLDEVDSVTYVGRNSVSFTTDLAQVRPAGTTASGQVTHIGTTYKTFAVSPGVVFATVGSPFHAQMVGMYFQFGSGPQAGVLYRIVATTGTSASVVLAGTTTIPTFTDQTLLLGGAFSGVSLVKSANFDLSTAPELKGDVDFLGAVVQGDPLAGFTPCAGELWCPGWTCITPSAAGQNAKVFEDADSSAAGTIDPMDVGADAFEQPLYKGSAGDMGELHFNGTDSVNEPATPDATFWATDSQTYNLQGGNASSQPNGTRPFSSADATATADPLGAFAKALLSKLPPPKTPTPVLDASGGPFIDKDPAVSPKTLASKNANPKLRMIQDSSTWGGKRFITTAFYDPIQDAVSNPGPMLTIAPSPEEAKNPSGSIRFLLTGLPQRNGHELWIFESLSDGDAATLFRVARFDASAYSFAVSVLEEQIGDGPPLQFSNFAPPECRTLASTGTRLFYGALTNPKQLDGVMYSQAGRPVSLKITPVVGFFRVASGFGDEITGMHQLDEIVIVGKDHGIAAATIGADDLPRVETLSSGVGIIAPGSLYSIDDRAYFLSEMGIHMVSRAGVTNLGVPRNVSGTLEQYFSFVTDKRYSRSFVAAINRQRGQYVLITREVGDTRSRNRITAEVFVRQNQGGSVDEARSGSSHRFSRYAGPDLTALGGFQSTPGGVETLIGGTLDGFLLWLDREDTQAICLGGSALIYGDKSLVGSTGSGLTGFSVTGTIDDELEGPRGTALRYVDAGGVERSVTCLGSSGTVLLLDERAEASLPSGGTLLVGVQGHSYETPWMDMGNPERMKGLHYLNLIFRSEPTGTMRVDLYSDFDRTTIKSTQDEPLSRVLHQVNCQQIPGRWFKAVLSVPFGAVDTKFELVSAVWRVRDEDQD